MSNVGWYLFYKLSYRDLEEMAAEHGLEVDHTTIYRRAVSQPILYGGGPIFASRCLAGLIFSMVDQDIFFVVKHSSRSPQKS